MGSTRKPHRGAIDRPVAFATDFVQKRLAGFSKDMRICLTGVPLEDEPSRITHAYFPALMSCCGTLEYLAGLAAGHANRSLGHQEIAAFAAKYMGPAYGSEMIRVLYEAFRNKVAHRGIASGVWQDHRSGNRVTWKVDESDAAPALSLVAEIGSLTYDPPWQTPYTHRMHIHLGLLWREIRDSGHKYVADLATSPELQRKFSDCMMHLYPLQR